MKKAIAFLLALGFALTAGLWADNSVATNQSVSADAGQAVVTSQKFFLEPSGADYDQHSKAIMAQQGTYADAKNAYLQSGGKDLESMKAAIENAVFYFQIAWIYSNGANFLLTNGTPLSQGDIAQRIKAYLDKGDSAVNACRATGGDKRIEEPAKKLARNRDHLNERLGKLGAAAASEDPDTPEAGK